MADADARAAEPADFLRAEMDAVGLMPYMSRQKRSSSLVSQRWVWSWQSWRSASAAVSVISRRVTENGEHGASAMRICAPGAGSWNSFSTRSLSRRIVSSSWTTSSGGRPPSFFERFIEPRVTVIRRPTSRAASTSMSTAFSRPAG
jgi:hypothetical protein